MPAWEEEKALFHFRPAHVAMVGRVALCLKRALGEVLRLACVPIVLGGWFAFCLVLTFLLQFHYSLATICWRSVELIVLVLAGFQLVQESNLSGRRRH